MAPGPVLPLNIMGKGARPFHYIEVLGGGFHEFFNKKIMSNRHILAIIMRA
jgi:hypothetical protein